MMNERNIGRVISVDSMSIAVQLDDDIKSQYKSGFQEIYPVARINAYIILPVGADRIVAMVNRVLTREDADLNKSNGAIFLSQSSRIMYATMLGTIEQGTEYKAGVYNFPILDNPVWYATREDLDKIFDQTSSNEIDFAEDFYLPVGYSPVFPEYKVKINPDKLFAKHAAILGNTGSGKSCTLTSILQSLFDYKYGEESKELHGAHIIIFDTNGEYSSAFNTELINPLVIEKDDLKVPYWFMNFADMDYLFEPTSGTQAPILKRALSMAKGRFQKQSSNIIDNTTLGVLSHLLSELETGNRNKINTILYQDLPTVLQWIKQYKEKMQVPIDLTNLVEALEKLMGEQKKLIANDPYPPKGTIDLDVVRTQSIAISAEIIKYKESCAQIQIQESRNIDMPTFYEFDNLVNLFLDYAIRENQVSEDKMREYISTLKLRMRSYVDDLRIAKPLMLDTQTDFNNSLSKFLAFILGDYAKVYSACTDDDDIYKDYRSKEDEKSSTNSNSKTSQVTVIDMSMVPYQVLDSITGLIGRLVLEFLSNFPAEKRASMPVAMVLEEAQNYIPEFNAKDRESISKQVFERIAREGRKFGLSLIVSSQRPSELSKTVLSQCNSFIIHRIQNPDDQQYIRKLVSAASAEVLTQLPVLPQQFAIIMGDAVRTPVVTKIFSANPRPKSHNPRFIESWLEDPTEENIYEKVTQKWLEINKNAEAEGEENNK